MSHEFDTDVLVVGAGPAGLCAALRLQQLGYQVALVERCQPWRANIGEALTPGVAGILELLEATETIGTVPRLSGLPTRLIWSSPQPDTLPLPASADQLVVDRGAFDHRLLQLVGARGGRCMVPAEVGSIAGTPGAWRIAVREECATQLLRARLILDARGRGATAGTRRMPLAPSLLAIWAEMAQTGRQTMATQVEAMPGGWLWGSPLPSGAYRVMSFCDPATLRHSACGGPEKWLRGSLAASCMFAELAQHVFTAPLQACSATPYIDERAWSAGRLKLGDAAFAIDPLSFNGVEKAMRFALQAVAAAHTMLSDPASEMLARDFFQERLLDSAGRHCAWTRSYYAQAWPGERHDFWRDRAGEFHDARHTHNPIAARLHRALRTIMAQSRPRAAGATGPEGIGPLEVTALLNLPMALSAELSFVEESCIVQDRVQRRLAVNHPRLDGPVAQVEGEEIAQLLRIVPHVGSLATAIDIWANRMPRATAMRLVCWCLQNDLLSLASTEAPTDLGLVAAAAPALLHSSAGPGMAVADHPPLSSASG